MRVLWGWQYPPPPPPYNARCKQRALLYYIIRPNSILLSVLLCAEIKFGNISQSLYRPCRFITHLFTIGANHRKRLTPPTPTTPNKEASPIHTPSAVHLHYRTHSFKQDICKV